MNHETICSSPIIAAALIVVTLLRDHHVVWAQEPDRIPGPIIEDPPGSFKAHTYVAAPIQLVSPAAAVSTFVVTYNGFTPQAQTAFQAAVDVWASQIQSSVPIRVTANWTTLGPGILGSAGPRHLFRNFPGAPDPNTWFPGSRGQQAERNRSRAQRRRHRGELQLIL